MSFKPFDRLPVMEWASWWDKTIDRWHTEGLAPEIGRGDLKRHLGLDLDLQHWVYPRTQHCPKPAFHGGPIMQTEADYDRIRPFLYPRNIDFSPWAARAKLQAAGDAVLWFTVDGFFWFPRTLFGIEPHLYAFYDQPQLMHRINQDLTDWMIWVTDRICEFCTPDFMTFGEDMSYNHGPMLSRELFDEFMKPYYRQVIPHLKSRNILPIVDSDGDITVPAVWFEEAGIEGILPLERQAGVDVARIRSEHPRMRFIGCFDKMCMNKGEAAMRAEFERLIPVAAQGGLIISCDHQTPPGVSWSDYQLYLRLFREYALEAGRMGQASGLAAPA